MMVWDGSDLPPGSVDQDMCWWWITGRPRHFAYGCLRLLGPRYTGVHPSFFEAFCLKKWWFSMIISIRIHMPSVFVYWQQFMFLLNILHQFNLEYTVCFGSTWHGLRHRWGGVMKSNWFRTWHYIVISTTSYNQKFLGSWSYDLWIMSTHSMPKKIMWSTISTDSQDIFAPKTIGTKNGGYRLCAECWQRAANHKEYYTM